MVICFTLFSEGFEVLSISTIDVLDTEFIESRDKRIEVSIYLVTTDFLLIVGKIEGNDFIT